MRKLLILFGCLPLVGQYYQPDYILSRNVSLTASADAITIQQPATGTSRVQLISAYAYCSVACTITIERDGSAATGTVQATVPISHGLAAGYLVGYVASNVGAGTVLGVPYDLPAGGSVTLDLSSMAMLNSGSGTPNFTMSPPSRKRFLSSRCSDVEIVREERIFVGGSAPRFMLVWVRCGAVRLPER